MARMKDIKDKFIILKDKFKTEKSDDLSLKLSYDTNMALNNILSIKEFCTEMRRIGSYGFVTYSIRNDDKKLKKKSLSGLSSLYSETSSRFHDGDPMRGSLLYSSMVLTRINDITKEYEKNIKKDVIEPLTEIEGACIEIQEWRKKLHDLKRDLLSLNEKLDRLLDQSTADDQKCSILREQIEAVEVDFENDSDAYIQKVLQFDAFSLFDYSHAIYKMVKLRTEYHENCSKELLKILPEANQFMEARRMPFSFRYPLENHLREIKKCIAYPIEKCVTALSNVDNLRQEGLFRVSGSMSKSNLLCCSLNIMQFDQMSCQWSPNVLADALKRYLREMPLPLCGKVSSSDWDSCYEKSKCGRKDDAYLQVKDLLTQMPQSYYNNLEYLIRFLNKVVQEQSHNRMGIQNICTVFTPNLFRRRDMAIENMEISASYTFVLEGLLNETDFFFPSSNKRTKPKRPEMIKIPRSIIKPTDQIVDSDLILFRSNPDNFPDTPLDRPDIETRSQRRRQRCLDSSIITADDSVSPRRPVNTFDPPISPDRNYIETPVPIPPPRRNKKI